MRNLFAEWLPEVSNDEIVFMPSNIDKEALGNLWTFSLTKEYISSTTLDECEEFVNNVLASRKAALRSCGYEPGAYTFYCWHDAMAGQLRFSMVSSHHGVLPFGTEIIDVADLRHICKSFLSSPYLDGISWEELETDSAEMGDDDDDKVYPLEVWSVRIP